MSFLLKSRYRSGRDRARNGDIEPSLAFTSGMGHKALSESQEFCTSITNISILPMAACQWQVIKLHIQKFEGLAKDGRSRSVSEAAAVSEENELNSVATASLSMMMCYNTAIHGR